MNRILALWATPRSTSTAFLQSMNERGDFLVQQEPFCLSYYRSEDRISTRFVHEPALAEQNYRRVLARVLAQAEQEAVFFKDMASHVIHLADAAFLCRFENTFLIRDPAKMLPSLFNRLPDFTLEEAGYAALWTLFEKVRKVTGRIPVVVDADDLTQRPQETMRAYCAAVQIPFIPQALTWQIPPETRFSHLDNTDEWFTYLKSSQGFQERTDRCYPAIHEHEHLQRAYEACLPYYTQMYPHRLAVQPAGERSIHAS